MDNNHHNNYHNHTTVFVDMRGRVGYYGRGLDGTAAPRSSVSQASAAGVWQKGNVMIDRCLFMADELAVMYVDDFCVLPVERMPANVWQGMSEAVARHEALWAFTH